MLCGLDQLSGRGLSALRRRLRESEFALLTHGPATDRQGRQTLTVLTEQLKTPKVVFAPEHGLQGYAQAEEAVAHSPASDDAARVVSLYGKTKESLEPSTEDLDGVQTLIIDLCDVGSRYYTYVWTALLAARKAQSLGIHTLVLDRPNPLSGDPSLCEGKPQDPEYTSFVGLERLPIRHGLTIGEILAYYFTRDGHALGADGALSVVGCAGWERHRTASAWGRPFVPPSPNMPTLETALVYPGGCLVEGTNLSEGRGTTMPFQSVGAPFLNAERLAQDLAEVGIVGAQIRPIAFRPSFEKHAGAICHGVMLHVTEPELFRPVVSYLALICVARRQAPEQFEFLERPYEFETDKPAFDLLTGSAAARQAILDDRSVEEVLELVTPAPAGWRETLLSSEQLVIAAQP